MSVTRERMQSETAAAAMCIARDELSYPANLREIPLPPERLWVRGRVETDDSLAIAIVGAREATPYGLGCAERLAADLAARGVTVVSGRARARGDGGAGSADKSHEQGCPSPHPGRRRARAGMGGRDRPAPPPLPRPGKATGRCARSGRP